MINDCRLKNGNVYRSSDLMQFPRLLRGNSHEFTALPRRRRERVKKTLIIEKQFDWFFY